MGRDILKLASQWDRRQQWLDYMERLKMEQVLIVAHKCIPIDPTLPLERLPLYCPENPAFQAPVHRPPSPFRPPMHPVPLTRSKA